MTVSVRRAKMTARQGDCKARTRRAVSRSRMRPTFVSRLGNRTRRRSLFTFSAAVVRASASCALPLLPGVGFKILARAAELREGVFEIVGQQGHAEKIFPGRALGPLARLSDGAFPLVRLEIAAPDPGERDQCGGFVDIQVLDEFDELPADRMASGVAQHGALPIIRGIRGVRLDAD